MKIFQVPKGTSGKLITTVTDPVDIEDWTTTKDLTFSEIVLDPVILFNNRGSYDYSDPTVILASRGYAVFGGADGGDSNAVHILAVPYDEVRVI